MHEVDSILDRAMSRRAMLHGTALVGAGAFLAACGTGGTASSAPTESPATSAAASSGPSAGPSETPAPSAPAQTPSAELNWANWTYYMDFDDKTKTFPTLIRFKEKYGTTVKYQEIVDDNDTFFGTIQPALQAGQDTGWDIVTLTEWMAARLVRLGWLEKWDSANMPNYPANLKARYRDRAWDPDNAYAVPWQSGTTGLGYDKSVTGELTSVLALFTVDSRWKGKTVYLTEMRDTVGLAMLSVGIDPTTADRAGCDAAIAQIKKAQDAGIVRGFKGNAYAEDLKSGDAVLATAWSGDMNQAVVEKPTLQFTIPTEGGMIWTDNCLIPKGAAHKYTAEVLLNYYYDPVNAADVELYVNYLCPVQGADEVMLQKQPDIKDNPIAFPPQEIQDRLKEFNVLSAADEAYFNQQFAKVIGV